MDADTSKNFEQLKKMLADAATLAFPIRQPSSKYTQTHAGTALEQYYSKIKAE